VEGSCLLYRNVAGRDCQNFLGFARSYFLRSQYFSTPLALIAKVHGAVFLSWAMLLLVQTVLVARRRRRISTGDWAWLVPC
jgi:hypothetical protein